LYHHDRRQPLEHADALNGCPKLYPTTSLTYLEIYLRVLNPTTREDFHISPETRTCGFWEYIQEMERCSQVTLQDSRVNTSLQYNAVGRLVGFGEDMRSTRSLLRIEEHQAKNHDEQQDLQNPGKANKELPVVAGITRPYTAEDIEGLATTVPLPIGDERKRHIGLINGRNMFISTTGFMGLVPDIAREGDQIAVLFGCREPFVVRPDHDHYLLVGPCYVLGLMNGEALNDLDESRVTDLYFW
jgi:hypothetical protein